MTELTPDLIRRVLVATQFDYSESIFWREDDGVLTLYAQCSDFFDWGCADLESIETAADVALLEQSLVDLRAATEDRWPLWLTELYAARRRGMQPAAFMLTEGSRYRIEDGIRTLFLALPPNPRDVQRPA